MSSGRERSSPRRTSSSTSARLFASLGAYAYSRVADGLAVRTPHPRAVEIVCKGAERIVVVGDPEIRAAMTHYYTDTHNLAEGAGAAVRAGRRRRRLRFRAALQRDLETLAATVDYLHLYRGDRSALAASLERIQRTAATILRAMDSD